MDSVMEARMCQRCGINLREQYAADACNSCLDDSLRMLWEEQIERKVGRAYLDWRSAKWGSVDEAKASLALVEAKAEFDAGWQRPS